MEKVYIRGTDTAEVVFQDDPHDLTVRITGGGMILVNSFDSEGNELSGQIPVADVINKHSNQF